MNTTSRIALLACIAAVFVAPSAAAAKTIGPGPVSHDVTLRPGQTLNIRLSPADSGSTGYHWRFAFRPPSRLMTLTSNRTGNHGKYQVLSFRARGTGATPLFLEYVPPGTGRTAVKSFSIWVSIDRPVPRIGCRPRGATTVASTSDGRIFKVSRSVFVAQFGGRVPYDAYYACDWNLNRAFPLANLGPNIASNASENDYTHVTLNDDVVGYEFRKDCPFVHDCTDQSAQYVVSQDLHTGRVIRRVVVGSDPSVFPVTGFVVSRTGGLAWIEAEDEGANSVHRSDLPAPAGRRTATEGQVLDTGQDGHVDPASLSFDGTQISWTRDGVTQRAPLR